MDYEVVVSNETGYIDWTYTGGYGKHEFEAVEGDEVPLTVTGHTYPTSVSEDMENAGVSPVTGSNFSNNNNGTVNCGYTLVSVTIVALGAAGVIFWFRLRE